MYERSQEKHDSEEHHLKEKEENIRQFSLSII